MKIGIYVGSFNPPHKGHIKIVNHLINNYLDKVIIIPTGNYWNKLDLVSINDRINMLKFYEKEKIIIDNKNNNLEYTYQILNNLVKKYKKDELYLIIGADNIVNFDKWKNYKEILEYNLIILNRDNIDVLKYLDKLNKKDKYIIVNDLPNIDTSSTMIRNKIKNKDYNNLSMYIDNCILNYIKENKLYEGEL
ncbi:MAG: nicotinate (nicotinamide) nucleotide adenylyltransferase [Bacilli bacterium]|nr:nicotinate (nicotinamide) nucleotide adenylyltransferase [Bacilli bacterium]